MLTGRRFGLDALRATAIGLVLFEHGRWFTYQQFPQQWYQRIPAGYLGVELFFVLSGYLVGGMALDAGRSLGSFSGLRSFWVRRWMRTLPNYFLFAVVMWWVAGGLGRWRPDSPLPWFTFTQNLAWDVPHWFRASWSLAIEEWFYLLFPLGLGFLLWRGASPRRAAILCIAIGTIIYPALRVAAVQLHDVNFWTTRHVVVLHADPIAWGVLAAAVSRWFPREWAGLARAPIAGSAVVLLVCLTLWLGLTDHEQWAHRTITPTLFSVAIALLLPWLAAWRVRESRTTNAVRLIARWSYSLYLVDGVVYLVLFLVWPGFPRNRVQALAYVLLYWTTCVTLAAWVYRLWEKPWLDLRDRARSGPPVGSARMARGAASGFGRRR